MSRPPIPPRALAALTDQELAADLLALAVPQAATPLVEEAAHRLRRNARYISELQDALLFPLRPIKSGLIDTLMRAQARRR